MYKMREEIENKYRFVTIAALRAEQLQMGARARVEAIENRKATIVAQEEVATGLVDLFDPDAPAPEAELLETAEES
jgi:DNA-directed RNA polymerase omega subunit